MGKELETSCIDQTAGVETCGGSRETYLQILALMQGYGNEKRALIQKSFEERDWITYGNEVHAMKSSAAGIGAFSLSEAAKALEEATDERNMDYVNSHQKEFEELLEKVFGEIDRILEEG